MSKWILDYSWSTAYFTHHRNKEPMDETVCCRVNPTPQARSWWCWISKPTVFVVDPAWWWSLMMFVVAGEMVKYLTAGYWKKIIIANWHLTFTIWVQIITRKWTSRWWNPTDETSESERILVSSLKMEMKLQKKHNKPLHAAPLFLRILTVRLFRGKKWLLLYR